MNEHIHHFEYEVSGCLFLSESEIDDIIRIGVEHYDFGCKQDATKGFLHAWKFFYATHKPEGEIVVKPSETGRVCKILEMEHHYGVRLYSKWYDILKAMLAEQERLNAPWMAEDELRPKAYREELKARYGL